MLCPLCSEKLQHDKYEDFGIRRCPKCGGMLLYSHRIAAIRNRIQKTPEELIEELRAAPPPGERGPRIRCPQCRVTMRKERHHLGDFEFWIDVCADCKLVWVDAGELAALQLAFELSDQAAERQRIRERLQNMSEQERAALQERIDSLPERAAFRNLFSFHI